MRVQQISRVNLLPQGKWTDNEEREVLVEGDDGVGREHQGLKEERTEEVTPTRPCHPASPIASHYACGEFTSQGPRYSLLRSIPKLTSTWHNQYKWREMYSCPHAYEADATMSRQGDDIPLPSHWINWWQCLHH